jgi:hypothetical protein
MILEFGFQKEDYRRTNSAVGFFDPLPRNFGTGLGLGTSQIHFFPIFQNNEYFSCDIALK